MRFKDAAVTFFALCGLMLTSSVESYAQPTATTVAPAAPAPAPFSFSLSASRTRSLYDYKDGSLTETNDFEFLPAYTWSKGKTIVYLSYSQDLRATEAADASDLNDIVIINSLKGWELSKVKLTPSFNVTIPESKVSRQIKNLEGGFSAKLTVGIRKELLVPGFYFNTAVSGARSFHRYTTDTEGQLNTQYSSRQSILTGYEFGIFSIDTEFHHINSWTYTGAQKESFEHTEEVSMAIGDHYGFTLGHTNSGSVFAANGYSSNYKLIDDNNSLVYAKVSMQF